MFDKPLMTNHLTPQLSENQSTKKNEYKNPLFAGSSMENYLCELRKIEP